MPKAVLRNGLIHPVEPLPSEWHEGEELDVQKARDDSVEDFDQWRVTLESMVKQNDPKDLELVEAAITQADEMAKAQVRKELGLP